MPLYQHPNSFVLESGAELPALEIQYHTYGRLNARADNAVWVFHALTGNSAVHEWWPEMMGPGRPLDPARHYIVCANMLGSCYGTTSPQSADPRLGRPYGPDFPLITVRDMVRAHRLLADRLGLGRIRLAIGGSMGGQQALEWAVEEPDRFDQLCVLATNAFHSPWGIAFNEAQRMALESGGREQGLETAGAIAMLSYRNYGIFGRSQSEGNAGKIDGYRASSYQRYQGEKLRRRFDPDSYRVLSKAMDSHHLGRGRESAEAALASIRARTLVVGIRSDILFPVEEQEFLARHIPQGSLVVIESPYGHDGFLVETETIGRHLLAFLNRRPAAARPTYLPGTESF